MNYCIAELQEDGSIQCPVCGLVFPSEEAFACARNDE